MVNISRALLLCVCIAGISCSGNKNEKKAFPPHYLELYKQLYIYSAYLQQNSFHPQERDSLLVLKMEQICNAKNISKEELLAFHRLLLNNPDKAIIFFDTLVVGLEKEALSQ
jgi:hypothetical protein